MMANINQLDNLNENFDETETDDDFSNYKQFISFNYENTDVDGDIEDQDKNDESENDDDEDAGDFMLGIR
jgi:hypothetical protein